jgi:lipoprotein-releasing system permease protein
MNLSFFLAKRYLVAKKKHNIINVISWISIIGVATGTFALIVVLSVFNGFDVVIRSLYNSFDPEIKIELTKGKFFDANSVDFNKLEQIKGIAQYCTVIEENALLQNNDKQYPALIKGVSNTYNKVTGIDSMLTLGHFNLDDNMPKACVGEAIAYYLGIARNTDQTLQLYTPNRTDEVSLDPEKAFNRRNIAIGSFFSVEQEYDSKYVIVPLSFARDLINGPNLLSGIEVKLQPNANLPEVKAQLSSLLGVNFSIKDRYEQQELFYKIIKSERWAIFFILTFILLVSSINITGSLTMLIIEKKNDMVTFRSMGMSQNKIRKIFLTEGWLISLAGAVIGLVLGIIVCWLQMNYGLIKLNGSGSFIIDAYPVDIRFMDIVLTFVTVAIIGFIASWYPIRFISKKFFLAAE